MVIYKHSFISDVFGYQKYRQTNYRFRDVVYQMGEIWALFNTVLNIQIR
jgi:hypothetical protein